MKVFSLLLSIILFPSPVQPQRQWGDWGSWSSCSRTCGGGITFQERKCLTKNCVGENKIHRSCNIQDCPNGGNFRQEQCAAYNSLPYLGKLYEWFPYSGVSDNPCSLNCMPKNEFFYDKFKDKVIDGTRCNDDTYNMCADGVCKKAGCDLILGSDAKEDKCRVCNGGGNNCRTIQNIYTGNKKGRGYVDILSIPPGATNIFIKEVTLSSNFLALKNSSHSFILNGNRNIKRPRKYQGPGTIIKYKRSRKEESIFALGPTTDILYLSLLSLGGHISISYEYSVPNSQKITDKLIRYSWKTGQYGECNRKCNGGEKSRKVYCVGSHDNAEVVNSKCSISLKPKETKVCNQQHCPPRWFIGAWSPCSLSCGEGTQVRRVHCERETPEGIEMLDEKRHCIGDKAITQRKCIVFKECPKWALRKWSECSKTCGGGIRTRTVECVAINNNVIGNDKCPEHNKPRDQEICKSNPCDVRWVSSDWGSCHPSCGKGMRTRSVYCASSIEIKRRYPDFMCNTIAKPKTIKPCNSSKSCPPMWYGSSWSKCTIDCGKGIQMRNVFCGVKEKGTDYLKILSHNKCKYLPELKTIQVCTIKPCHTQWIVSSWKPCSSKCGNGKILRDVRCFADSEEDKTEKSCDAKKKPLTEDTCNLVECPAGSITNPNFEKLKVTLGITQSTIQPTTNKPTNNPTRSPPTTRSPPRTLESTRTPSQPASTRTLRVHTTAATVTVDNSIEGTSMPAMIVRGPANDEAVVGSDIILPCEAKGNPKPDIFWLKGNLDVSVFGQRFQVLPNGYLKIIAVQEVDEDVYTCVANNVISRRSQPAYLLVTTLPYVDMTLGYTVKEGEVAHIECGASGKPRPTVEWYKDGNFLKVQRNDKMVVTTQAITIMSVQLADHGKYKCKATNKNGETPGYMMLDVLPDEKTRLHDIMNGKCEDVGELENCEMAAKLENYCDKPYYQMVCCKTCREKHKGRLGSL